MGGDEKMNEDSSIDSSSSSSEELEVGEAVATKMAFCKEDMDHLMHEMCKSSQWRVVFEPLKNCLSRATEMVLAGQDATDKNCKHFLSYVVIESLDKLTSSEPVLNWKDDIHEHIFDTLTLAVELAAFKIPTMDADSCRFISSLCAIFDVSSNFNIRNRRTPSSFTGPVGEFANAILESEPEPVEFSENDDESAGKAVELSYQWLTDLINIFGLKGGFDAIRNRIIPPPENFDFSEVAALMGPLNCAARFSTDFCAKEYLFPICQTVLTAIENLTDKQLKTQHYQQIVYCLNSSFNILVRLNNNYLHSCKIVDDRRMDLALRMLKIQSFERQLGALKEICALIKLGAEAVVESSQRYQADLSHSRLCEWLLVNQVLQTAMQNHLHHKQYVDQIAKLSRFLLRNDCFSDKDVESLWAATEGKHETIVNNLYDMIAQLTTSLQKRQLDLLFGKLEVVSVDDPEAMGRAVVLVARLAAGDTRGDICTPVLELLWKWAHDQTIDAVVQETIIQRLPVVLRRYDALGFASRDSFSRRCLDHVSLNTPSSLVSVKILHRILATFPEEVSPTTATEDDDDIESNVSRSAAIESLDKSHGLLALIVNSIVAHKAAPETQLLDSDKEEDEIENRLQLLVMILLGSSLLLKWEQACLVWDSLVSATASDADRNRCFNWLSIAMGPYPQLDPSSWRLLLIEKLQSIPPAEASLELISSYERVFYHINVSEEKMLPLIWTAGEPLDDLGIVADVNLEGLDYFWNVAMETPDEALGARCIRRLRHFYTRVSPDLSLSASIISQAVVDKCISILGSAAPLLLQLGSDVESESAHVRRAERCLSFLQEFIVDSEAAFAHPRKFPAHGTTFRGRPLGFVINAVAVPSLTLGANKKFNIEMHTNATVGQLRERIAAHLKTVPRAVRMLTAGRELQKDSVLLESIPFPPNNMINIMLRAKQALADVSASDENTESQVAADAAKREAGLPGVLLSRRAEAFDLLFSLADAPQTAVRRVAWSLLMIIPSALSIQENLAINSEQVFSQLFSAQNSVRIVYNLQLLDGFLIPIIGEPSADNSTAFSKSSGPNFLVRLLPCQEDNLPANIEVDLRRECYTITLRLLKYLLVGSVPTSGLETYDPLRLKQLQTMALNGVAESLVGLCCYIASGHLDSVIDSVTKQDAAAGDEGAIKRQREAEKREAEITSLFFQSMDLLSLLIGQQPVNLFSHLFLSPGKSDWVVRLLLVSSNPHVRQTSMRNLAQIAALVDRSGTVAMINYLLSVRDSTTVYSGTSWEFFSLIHDLLEVAFKMGIPAAELRLEPALVTEISYLKIATTPATDADSILLAGRLRLLEALVGYNLIDKTQHNDSVLLILHKFLFSPSAVFQTVKRQNVEMDLSAISGLIRPICSTPTSRAAAFSLVTQMCKGCPENILSVVRFLHEVQYADALEITDWNFTPTKAAAGAAVKYVGLKNAGATCYMNSIFQQLFMQPALRSQMLSVVLPTDKTDLDQNGKVFFELQKILGFLQASQLDTYTPLTFWQTFQDLDGMPINVREHQDADEFLTRLADQVDDFGMKTDVKKVFERTFGGTMADQLIGKTCPHRKQRTENFLVYPVEVGKGNLADALEASVKGDLLEGENAYSCDQCEKKVDALKRVCLKDLPSTLVLHLKRFSFDYSTMQRLKVKDHFEFPFLLDMEPYTVDGLTSREAGTGPTPPIMYSLSGVVVHSGSAEAGHYYSFIRETAGHGVRDAEKHNWFQFNDTSVEPYDVSLHERDWFGGSYVMEMFDHHQRTHYNQLVERPYSAYILIYSRIDDSVPPPVVRAREEYPLPERLRRQIVMENLSFMHEMHIVDECYLDFMYQFMFTAAEAASAESDAMAVAALDLSLSFLTRMYFKLHPSLQRHTHWANTVSALADRSSSGPITVLNYLSAPKILKLFLLECPLAEVRASFSGIFVQALYWADRQVSVAENRQLLELMTSAMMNLVGLLPDVPVHWEHCQQLMFIFQSACQMGFRLCSIAHSFKLFPLLVDAFLRSDIRRGVNHAELHATLAELLKHMDLSRWHAPSDTALPPIPGQYHPTNLILDAETQAVLEGDQYLSRVLRFCPHDISVRTMVEILSFERPTVSKTVMEVLLYEIRGRPKSAQAALVSHLEIFVALISIPDSFASLRYEIMFEEDYGLLSLLRDDPEASPRRAYCVFKYVVRAALANADLLSYLNRSEKCMDDLSDYGLLLHTKLDETMADEGIQTADDGIQATNEEAWTAHDLTRTKSSMDLLESFSLLFQTS